MVQLHGGLIVGHLPFVHNWHIPTGDLGAAASIFVICFLQKCPPVCYMLKAK